jgi:hypothetical protein
MTMPKWTRIYLLVTGAMAALFSVLAYADPSKQFAGWTALTAAGATSLAGPLGVYIARNLATVAVSVFCAVEGSRAALTSALLLRAVSDGLDAVHNGLGGNGPGVGFAAVMFVVDVAALVAVRRRTA